MSRAAIKVGITGGIGSGKSIVCKVFNTLGIPIYNADYRAKYLMHNNQELKNKIISLFGEKAYLDGKLNRKYIAKIVFADKERLEALNSVVHPAVALDTEEWYQRNKKKKYVLKEAALIFETNGQNALDKVITIAAPTELRMHRVMKRDNATEEEVMKRMNSQIPQEEKIKLSDYVIFNDGINPVLPQIWKFHMQMG